MFCHVNIYAVVVPPCPKIFSFTQFTPLQIISNVLKLTKFDNFSIKWQIFVCFACIFLPDCPSQIFSCPPPNVDAGTTTVSHPSVNVVSGDSPLTPNPPYMYVMPLHFNAWWDFCVTTRIEFYLFATKITAKWF